MLLIGLLILHTEKMFGLLKNKVHVFSDCVPLFVFPFLPLVLSSFARLLKWHSV